MPTYEYFCDDCGEFSALRSMDARNDPCACPNCGLPGYRVMSQAPALATMSSANRTAHQRNERAAHMPKTSAELSAHKHGPGCGCGSNSKLPSATVKAKDGSKMAPSKRPWMISH